ncbi:all-trans-8'-apo-beta-carotenal 15,15'-oxygenase [Eoetvoesiella caeni]|uniref:All-trans-8'-apo-beta-carotenal 15,15'-oxygenase n=2 Tax=Eoetvoesiella caeni TaxID=645616 RepID=A0A366HK84_9BURK|nr:all-trans-8'-apo-beta-carotenal 15,15'-oxygenase [Eoetvoesiella caeni]
MCLPFGDVMVDRKQSGADDDKAWLSSLACSMTQEHDYYPEVQGHLPAALQGSLYRNGPGRFELGGVRKTHLLDGDGMIQAFDFSGGRVRYRNRFVRTPKFLQEEQAGRFTLPTWTTRAPGGLWPNMGNKIKSQAGVTVVARPNCLYAFDEVDLPYGLDPATLETLGEQPVGAANVRASYKAHTKTDARTGDWLLLGVEFGRRMTLHLAEHAPDGALLRSQRVAAPRSAYFHDWFATERYVIVSLQPLQPSLPLFLAGLKSFTDSMRWRPELGNLLMIIDRSGAQKPLLLPAPACFMWHALNAYEQGNTIVADFVGYDTPDHFVGAQAAFRTLLQGRQGLQSSVGSVRRYVIDLSQKRVLEEVISAQSHEFPMLRPAAALARHRYGYFTTASEGTTVFHDGLARIDVDSGRRDTFSMGAGVHLGEAVFVADETASEEQGWLLSLGLDGTTNRSFLGVFAAHRLADGPVARIQLQHPTPLSFHGWWRAATAN